MTEATGINYLVSCFVDHCQGAQAVTVRFHTGFGFSYSGDCRPSKDFIRIGRGSTVLVHEATFDDEMQGDAKAKKHSTMSEAIGVASAMGAKRLILTHFSQRYQKLPNLGALSTEVEFDDPESSVDGAKDTDATQIFDETSPSTGDYDRVAGQDISTAPPAKGRTSPSASLDNSPPPSPTKHELKIAIAFDFLRVRVGDIASMEKFTPSLQLLFEMLEQREKEEAYHNPGEVARRKKEEQKQEKREAQEKLIKEKQEAKAFKKASVRKLRWNAADNKGDGNIGAPDSTQVVSEVTHLDRTEAVVEEAGLQSPRPVMEHAAK